MATIVGKVIIVHPSTTWRQQGCDALRTRGYSVSGFSHSASALAHLRTHSTDLVIADYSSIKTSLIKWRRLSGGQSRIVLLLRSQNAQTIAECFRSGADDCAVGPLDGQGLFEIVTRTLKKPTPKTALTVGVKTYAEC